jgi:hypothetical protein
MLGNIFGQMALPPEVDEREHGFGSPAGPQGSISSLANAGNSRHHDAIYCTLKKP